MWLISRIIVSRPHRVQMPPDEAVPVQMNEGVMHPPPDTIRWLIWNIIPIPTLWLYYVFRNDVNFGDNPSMTQQLNINGGNIAKKKSQSHSRLEHISDGTVNETEARKFVRKVMNWKGNIVAQSGRSSGRGTSYSTASQNKYIPFTLIFIFFSVLFFHFFFFHF